MIGVFLMLGAILWAMVDRYPGETFLPTGEMLATPLRNIVIALVAAVGLILILARYLPKTRLYRRFALMTMIPSGPSLAGAPREFATALDVTPGMQGTAQTTLRPSGKARLPTTLWSRTKAIWGGDPSP